MNEDKILDRIEQAEKYVRSLLCQQTDQQTDQCVYINQELKHIRQDISDLVSINTKKQSLIDTIDEYKKKTPKKNIPKGYMMTGEFSKKFGFISDSYIAHSLGKYKDFFAGKFVKQGCGRRRGKGNAYFFDPCALIEFVLFHPECGKRVKNCYLKMLYYNNELVKLEETTLNKRKENAVN